MVSREEKIEKVLDARIELVTFGAVYEKDADFTELRNIFRKSLEKLDDEVLEEHYQEALNTPTNEEFELNRRNRTYKDALILWEMSEVDLNYWCRMSQWKIEEALLLSIGKDPEENKNDFGVPLTTILYDQPDVRHYGEIKKVVIRAIESGELTDPISPIEYVKWSKKYIVNFPEDLAEVVFAIAEETDWEAKYLELENQFAEYRKENSKNSEEVENKSVEENTLPQKILSTRERNTLLKLVIGIAIEQYAYDPNKSRNEAASQISSDLVRHKISIDPDTIRKYFKQAIEVLPIDFSVKED